MKNTGIWLDKNKALIVTLENETETLNTVSSNIEHFKIHGGSGSRLKGGPQDVVQDSKYLEREKQQLKQYFKNIVTQVEDTDALVLFGPAETYKKFKKELENHYTNMNSKVKSVQKADSMTNNQVIALIKGTYKSK